MNQCIDKISNANNWISLSEEQIGCMEINSEFYSSLDVLCLADKSDISKAYDKFLDYKIKIDEAFSRFQAATNPGERTLANAELQDLIRDQKTYGVSKGIWEALDTINFLKYSCSNR